ncbi:hypothetical protein H0H87_008778 [Tephrocybe sp. NHM501043]|nr:hypothetical protein H0H87_008778 [Tephrocybe sp. NHM501043]
MSRHYKADCWALGGGKEGQGPKGKSKAKMEELMKDAAASAEAAKRAKDEAWMAIADENVLNFMEEDLNTAGLAIDDERDEIEGSSISMLSFLFKDDFQSLAASSTPSHSIPVNTTFELNDLLENYSSDDNLMLKDDYQDIPALQMPENSNDRDDASDDEPENAERVNKSENDSEEMLSSAKSGVKNSKSMISFEINEPEEDAYTYTFAATELTRDSPDGLGSGLIDVTLYDAGASCHTSGLWHSFINFHSITPKSITAADKWTFSATGMGDMYLTIPNSEDGPA